MISFSYPPLAGMGMLRSLKFAKFLPSFDWQPIVLTIDTRHIRATTQTQYWYCDDTEGRLSGVEIIRAKFISLKSPMQYLAKLPLFRQSNEGRSPNLNADDASVLPRHDSRIRDRFKSGVRDFWNTWIEFPDSAIGWYPYALTKALGYLRKNPVDAIFSTALPMTSHLVANSLSKKTGIPWVADFRDLWSQADFREVNRLRRTIDSCLEVRTVKSASALVTVSEPHMEDLLHLHKTFADKNYVIYNGYDAEDYMESGIPINRPFTITYTGRMYDIDFSSKGRTPLILFQSVAALFREKRIPSNRLQFLIYGEHPHELIKMVAACELTKNVKYLGAVPFREAVKAQQQADVLLHLNWNDSDQKGVLSGKIFEYLGAKKNILSIPFYNKGVSDILRATQAGVILNSVEACKEQIWRWFQAFEAHGAIPYHGIPEMLENYSRKKATEQLATILNQVSQRKA